MSFPDDMGSSMFIYSFIYLIIIYTQLKKKKKNSSGTKNSNTITNILRTKDHNPNII